MSRRPDFHVAVDVAIFSLRNDLLHIGVVQRRGDTAYIDQNQLPRRTNPSLARAVAEVPRDLGHHWALPGGHVGHTLLGDEYGTGEQPDTTLEDAAVRVLARETGLRLPLAALHQVGAFGDADRDPRSGRTVSIAYLAVVGDDLELRRHPQDDGAHVVNVQFRPLVDVLARPNRLEFDHEDIVLRSVALLRSLVTSTSLATRFCRPEFTIGELRRVYEVLFHESLDSAESAERHVDVVRAYLGKLEELGATHTPDLERTVSVLAELLPTTREEIPEDGLASRSAPPSIDLSRQVELFSRLLRQSSGMKPPRSPRLLAPLDPTNFARKVQKLGILEPVQGGSRPTFDRYGKPAALFRLDPDRADTPFLLRLDNLARPDSSE